MVEGGERAGGLAAHGERARISPEGGDVAPDPGEDGGLVLHTEILDAEFRQVEVAEGADTVVGGDDDDVAGGGQVPAVVPLPATGSAGESAAVEPHQDREGARGGSVDRQAGGPHVEGERAVLVPVGSAASDDRFEPGGTLRDGRAGAGGVPQARPLRVLPGGGEAPVPHRGSRVGNAAERGHAALGGALYASRFRTYNRTFHVDHWRDAHASILGGAGQAGGVSSCRLDSQLMISVAARSLPVGSPWAMGPPKCRPRTVAVVRSFAPSAAIIWRESEGKGGLVAGEFDEQGGASDPADLS